MNKSAWIGIAIALLLPLGGYFVMKLAGENAVDMPRRYFVDRIDTQVKDGKTTHDTIYHRLPDFNFINQLGETVSLQDMEGRIVVINTFFTRCPNICPALTRNVRKLQQSFENPKRKKYGDSSIVYFLSVSVDPQRDSVEALKKWADRFYVNSDSWSLVTGKKEVIYPYLLDELKLSTRDGGEVDSNFIHTEKLVLVDRDHIIRGYYSGLDSTHLQRLAEDIGKLFLERDRNKPSVFRQFIPVLPFLMVIPVLVFLLMWWFNRKRSEEIY